MTLSVRPLHPLFAAEVTGLDLREATGAAAAREFEDVMDRCAVGVLPGQRINDEQQLRFTRLFGELEVRPLQRGRNQVPDPSERIRHHEVFDVSNLDEKGKMLAPDDERRAYSIANRLWHTDSSFRQVSATYSMLSGRVVPQEGADTEFADLRAAWDALPDALKARLEGLEAEHSIWHSRMTLGGYVPNEAERLARPPARHPLVRVHPGSRRKTLYIASHMTHVIGMDETESRDLLDELMAFATQPRFVYAHKWRPFDLIVWDNRCTMHRATPFDDTLQRRDMRRTTVREKAAAWA
ncbi:MAG TPA: TauD/TfdA family dioxygenase [Stellaceae bacterium]|nr:TauD/TfdA family dioxygenase [Stellaceae bacterium]